MIRLKFIRIVLYEIRENIGDIVETAKIIFHVMTSAADALFIRVILLPDERFTLFYWNLILIDLDFHLLKEIPQDYK